jgi:hypothetical protein
MTAQKRGRYVSHATHNHPATPKARAQCRALVEAGRGPLDLGREVEVSQATAEGVSVQTSLNGVTHMTVGEWQRLIASLETAEAWLAENATLLRLDMVVSIGNRSFLATYSTGVGWAVKETEGD